MNGPSYPLRILLLSTLAIPSTSNRMPTRGSSKKGSHVYFLLISAMVLLLWCQIVLLWHQVNMVASEQHLWQNNRITQKTCNRKYTWLHFLLQLPSGYSIRGTENCLPVSLTYIWPRGHDLLSIYHIGFQTFIPEWSQVASCYLGWWCCQDLAWNQLWSWYLAHWCILSRICTGLVINFIDLYLTYDMTYFLLVSGISFLYGASWDLATSYIDASYQDGVGDYSLTSLTYIWPRLWLTFSQSHCFFRLSWTEPDRTLFS